MYLINWQLSIAPRVANMEQSASATDALAWKTMGKTAKMVESCCVIDCTDRKNSGRGFYRLLKGKENVKQYFLMQFQQTHVTKSENF